MQTEKYIEEALVKYKNIKKVFCPYFKKEVECSSRGFYHLIFERNRFRRQEDQIFLRMEAINYLKTILENSGTVQEIEQFENGQIFFAFIAIIEKKKYKVVVSTTVDDRLTFRSIIPSWKTGKRDEKLHTVDLKNSANDEIKNSSNE